MIFISDIIQRFSQSAVKERLDLVKEKLPCCRAAALTFFEALATVVITQIPFALSLILYTLNEPGATLDWTTTSKVADINYTPANTIGYITGILGSSTAWLLINLFILRIRVPLAVFLMFASMIIIVLSSPLFNASLNGQIGNAAFARELSTSLILVSLICWIASLYQQHRTPDIGMSSQKIEKDIIKSIQGNGK